MKNLDTHTAIKNLIAAGIPENQAEVIVSTITIEKAQSDLVTKSDLKLAMAELRAELKGDTAELRTELKGDIAKLDANIVELKRDMKWGMALLVGIMALSLSMIGVMAKIAFLS